MHSKPKNNDVLGQAIWDFYNTDTFPILWVHDHFGDPVEMDVALYFRDIDEMPLMEQRALTLCKGHVLDIGAGAGSHAIALEMRGLKVQALDVSPLCVQTMKGRGADNPVCADIFEWHTSDKFDTILLMMNGIGLCGTIDKLEILLQKFHQLLAPGGEVIFDSSDISYIFEDGDIPLPTLHYFGEVTCAYEYQNIKSDYFKWLYIDFHTLTTIAEQHGWKATLLEEDETGQYLCSLKRT